MSRNDVRPRKATISLRIDNTIKNAAKYYARQRQMPLAEVVRDLLAAYVDACAQENDRASPDLLGAKPAQFTGTRSLPSTAPFRSIAPVTGPRNRAGSAVSSR